MNKTETIRAKVTLECMADVITLAATFDSTTSQVVRWALDSFRGKRTPITAEEAREVLREANDG